MSQNKWATIDPATTSGISLATLLNDGESALHTLHSGTSVPNYVATGMLWWDITDAALWILKIHDGEPTPTNVPLLTFAPATSVITIFGNIPWANITGDAATNVSLMSKFADYVPTSLLVCSANIKGAPTAAVLAQKGPTSITSVVRTAQGKWTLTIDTAITNFAVDGQLMFSNYNDVVLNVGGVFTSSTKINVEAYWLHNGSFEDAIFGIDIKDLS